MRLFREGAAVPGGVAELFVPQILHIVVASLCVAVFLTRPNRRHRLLLPVGEVGDEVLFQIQSLESCRIRPKVAPGHIFVDALFDAELRHSLHGHLVDEAIDAHRLQVPIQVWSPGGNFLSRAMHINILDSGGLRAYRLVLDAATVSACGDGAHDVEAGQRGQIANGSAVLHQLLDQPGVVHTRSKRYFLGILVVRDRPHLFQGEVNAVGVCIRVKRVRRAEGTDVDFSLMLIMSFEKLGKLSAVLGPDDPFRRKLDVLGPVPAV